MDYKYEILLSLPTRTGGYCIVWQKGWGSLFPLLVNDQFNAQSLFGDGGEPRGFWQKESEKQRLTAMGIGNVNTYQHSYTW